MVVAVARRIFGVWPPDASPQLEDALADWLVTSELMLFSTGLYGETLGVEYRRWLAKVGLFIQDKLKSCFVNRCAYWAQATMRRVFAW